VPRVHAAVRVVAQQPPAGRTRGGGTTLDGALDDQRAVREAGHHEVAGPDLPAVLDQQPVPRVQGRLHGVVVHAREAETGYPITPQMNASIFALHAE
jgi:hypothetical protein